VATVLFVCLCNAGRSQMSAALFERTCAGRHRSLSAGTLADPDGHVHPEVIEAMREVGIDLSSRRPRPLTAELAAPADVVVTMGCGDRCPHVAHARHIDWKLEDPSGLPLERVRAIRDDIARRVEGLARELAADPDDPRGPT